jgi:hypothetical protein
MGVVSVPGMCLLRDAAALRSSAEAADPSQGVEGRTIIIVPFVLVRKIESSSRQHGNIAFNLIWLACDGPKQWACAAR